MEKREMKKILNSKLEIPAAVEEKVEESYRMLGIQTGKKKTRRTYRKLIPVAAAAAMLAATSLAALAANGFFTKEVVEEEQNLSYKFQMNYELTPFEVEITPGYIPDGYTEYEQGKYDKDGQHKNGISICPVLASWLAQQTELLDVSSLKDLEKTTLNGMEAHLLTLDYDMDRTEHTFDKRIYLFNPSEGYVAIAYGGNDISMEELKKVAENLKIRVNENKPSEYVPQLTEDEKEAEKQAEQEALDLYHAGVPSTNIKSLGDTYTMQDIYGKEVSYSLTDARVVDNISEIQGYDTKNFFNYDEIKPWIEEDGTLKPYERMTYQVDQGGRLITDSGVKDTAEQKFLVVTGTMKNQGTAEAEGWASGDVTNLVPKEDGSYAFNNIWTEPYNLDTRQFADGPQYFDQSQYRDADMQERSHFFFYNLQPGEELTYTLVWIVNSDQLENLFIKVNLDGVDGDDLFIDMSQS